MRRLGVIAGVVLALALVGAAPAWGHAGFEDPKKVPADSDQTLSQSIPEERGSDLHNAKVVVEVPAEFQVKDCVAEGWTCTAEPAGAGKGTLVTFSGTGPRELFRYNVHTPAKAGDYAFKVSQTYSDGKVVNWDGPISSDTPASFLTVVEGMMQMPATTCSPDGTDLKVAAKDTKYDKDCLAAPADTPFTIAFTNNDPVQHNIFIHPHGQSDRVLFQGDLFEGPKTLTYKVPALPAGTYMFMCSVHPSMFGKLVIGDPSQQPKMDMGGMDHTAMGGKAASGAMAAPAGALARTGNPSRRLVSGAGLALALGGLSVIGGARRRSPTTPVRHRI